jgi:hypothetical protein
LALCLGLFLAFGATSSSAQESARIALLIGNKDYRPEIGPLKNPQNDISFVGEALRVAGFTILDPVHDATRSKILGAVRQFAERLRMAGQNAVGVLYYSGHGAAIGTENYLIPVDVESPDAGSLADGGVPQSEIINRLIQTAPQAVHYLVIDACRHNLGGSKGPKGFRPEQRRDGMLIAFAASPGMPASDDGPNGGPFAKALAAELSKPAQTDLLLFHNVRVAVDQATGGEQVPWIEDGIRRPERIKLGVLTAPSSASPATYVQYIDAFALHQPQARGTPFTRDEIGPLAYSVLASAMEELRGTRWYGGKVWGTIEFDETGRRAKYRSQEGGSAERILLQGVLGDAGQMASRTRGVLVDRPILIGEWFDRNSQGGFILRLGEERHVVEWGPGLLRRAEWISVRR